MKNIIAENVYKQYIFVFINEIYIETVEVAFFVTGLETLQIQGVEMYAGGSTKSNVMLQHLSRFIY
jgi:hypothetical protein